MADKKISELNISTTAGAPDVLVVVQGGETKQMTVDTLASTFPSNLVIVEAVNAPTSGALDIDARYSRVTIPSNASSNVGFTLAAGTHGTMKVIVSTISAAYVGVLTISSGVGVTTVTFTQSGDSLVLQNISGLWYVLSSRGVTIG